LSGENILTGTSGPLDLPANGRPRVMKRAGRLKRSTPDICNDEVQGSIQVRDSPFEKSFSERANQLNEYVSEN
jgi:hypothetical protein